MLTISKPLIATKAPYQLVAGQTPVVTVPLLNDSATEDVQYTLTGQLGAASADFLMLLGPAGGQTGTIPPQGTGNIVLVGSPVGDQSEVGAASLALALTLTDRTNGVTVDYAMKNAFAVPAPEVPNIPSNCPTDWVEGPYPTQIQAVNSAIYLTAHDVDGPTGCQMFVWQLRDTYEGGAAPANSPTFYGLTIGIANPQTLLGNVTGNVIACYVNGQSVPFSPRSTQHVYSGPPRYWPVGAVPYNPKGMMPA